MEVLSIIIQAIAEVLFFYLALCFVIAVVLFVLVTLFLLSVFRHDSR